MKLFKKVAAAVLAGVMALSMVACANTPVVPEEKPIDPTKAPEQQVMDKINEYAAAFATANDNNAITIENELKDKAEKLLNAIAAGEAKDGTVTYKKESQVKAVGEAMSENHTYWFGIGSTTPFTAPTGTTLTLPDEYKASQLTKAKLGDFVTGTLVRVNKETAVKGNLIQQKKVGVASKTIDGKTYVMVVVK